MIVIQSCFVQNYTILDDIELLHVSQRYNFGADMKSDKER